VCNILQQIYTDVPTEREIGLAKASTVTLSSYRVSLKNDPPVTKQLKKAKKRTVKTKRTVCSKSGKNGNSGSLTKATRKKKAGVARKNIRKTKQKQQQTLR
jgi:hypothetical protein